MSWKSYLLLGPFWPLQEGAILTLMKWPCWECWNSPWQVQFWKMDGLKWIFWGAELVKTWGHNGPKYLGYYGSCLLKQPQWSYFDHIFGQNVFWGRLGLLNGGQLNLKRKHKHAYDTHIFNSTTNIIVYKLQIALRKVDIEIDVWPLPTPRKACSRNIKIALLSLCGMLKV